METYNIVQSIYNRRSNIRRNEESYYALKKDDKE
jgi:hypothetical protein